MNGLPQNLISYAKAVALGTTELKNLSLSRLRKVFSLMGKKEKIAAGILLLIAVVSLFISVRNFYYSHTNPVPGYGGSYSEGLLGQPTYINPLLAQGEPDLSLTQLLFSGLYKYDSNGQLEPDLADGMPVISADQKQYTVNLKKNVKWHNGQTFTADDVIFTIQTLQDPNFKSPLRALWQATTVTKLSDYSIQFTTKDISGPFINNLTLPILPKAVWENVGAQNFLLSKYNLQAIGTGPYAIKEIKKLPSGKVEQIILESFADYYGNRAKIDQLTFQFYDSGEDMLNAFQSREVQGIGFIPLNSNLYLDKNQPKAQVLNIPLPEYQVVFFNLNNQILADQNVRMALSLATDKQQIIDRVFNGNAILPTSPFVFNNGKNPPLPSTVNIAQAKQLLDSDGWTVDPKTNLRAKKGAQFAITIATNDSLADSNAAQILAAQWQALDIKVNLTVLPSQTLSDTLIKPRTFDVLLFPQKFSADPDPFPFWHSSQVKDPGYNLTGFSNPTADKLIVDARTTTDKAQRTADYVQFNQLVMSQIPVIFLNQTEFVYAIDNSVKNVNFNVLYDPSYRFEDINDWYINEARVWK